MKRMFLATAVLLCLPMLHRGEAAETAVDGLVVTVIDQIDVPALETGILKSLTVREGDRVTGGQVIGKLDDRHVQLQAKLVATELEIATSRANEDFASELAAKDYLQQQEMAEQHELLRDIAHRKAKNDIRVRASQKAEAVAKNEWTRASKARERFVDSVSKSELDGLKLVYERTQLETKQAAFERSIDLLNAKSEDKAGLLHEIEIEQAGIAAKQSIADKKVAALQAQAKQHAANLAALSIDRHQVTTKLSGIIVERYQRPGQWVQSGERIVRVVRLDRLRAEGFVSGKVAAKLRKLKQVELSMNVGENNVVRVGEVVFVSPEVNAVDGDVKVFIEFDNPDEDVLPGTLVRMIME